MAATFTGQFLTTCTAVPSRYIEQYAGALNAQGFTCLAMLQRLEADDLEAMGVTYRAYVKSILDGVELLKALDVGVLLSFAAPEESAARALFDELRIRLAGDVVMLHGEEGRMDMVDRSSVVVFFLSEAFLKSPVCLAELVSAYRLNTKFQLVSLVSSAHTPVDQAGIVASLRNDPNSITNFVDSEAWEYLNKRGIYAEDNSLLKNALIALLEKQPLVFAFGASKSRMASSAESIYQSLLPIRFFKVMRKDPGA